MKLGVLTVPLQGMTARDAFAYLHSLGVQTVELGTGGYTNNNHLKPEVYLDHPDKIAEFKDLLKEFDLEISVLSCHGNQNQYILDRYKEFRAYTARKTAKGFRITKDAGVFLCEK